MVELQRYSRRAHDICLLFAGRVVVARGAVKVVVGMEEGGGGDGG